MDLTTTDISTTTASDSPITTTIATTPTTVANEGNGAVRETRQYVLNRRKAVTKKLKDLHITDIRFEWKADGQCCVVDMNLVYFDLCRSAIEERFPDNNKYQWAIVKERTGKIVEAKLRITHNGESLVHVTMYHTKNRWMVQGKYALEFMNTDFPCLVQQVEQNKEEAEHYWSSLIFKGSEKNDDASGIEVDSSNLPTKTSDSDTIVGVNSSRRKSVKVATPPRTFSLKGLFKGSPSHSDVNIQSISMRNQMLEDKVITLEERIDTYVQEFKVTLMKQVNDLSINNSKLLNENTVLRNRVEILETDNVARRSSDGDLLRNIKQLETDLENISDKHLSDNSDRKNTLAAIEQLLEAERARVSLLQQQIKEMETRRESAYVSNDPAVSENVADDKVADDTGRKQMQETAEPAKHKHSQSDQVPVNHSNGSSTLTLVDVPVENRYDVISDTSLTDTPTTDKKWVVIDSLDDTPDTLGNDTDGGGPWENVPSRAQRLELKEFNYDVQIIGTSIVKNIDASKLYRRKRVRVCTLSDKTINGASEFLDRMKSKPRIILYQVSSNDLMKKPVEIVIKEMDKLVEKTRTQFRDTQIAVSAILPRWLKNKKDDRAFEDRRCDLNARLATYCEGKDGVTFIKHGTFVPDDTSDGIHLNAGGLPKLVRSYKQCINDILGMTPYTSYGQPRNHTGYQSKYDIEFPEINNERGDPQGGYSRGNWANGGQHDTHTRTPKSQDKKDVLLSKLSELFRAYNDDNE